MQDECQWELVLCLRGDHMGWVCRFYAPMYVWGACEVCFLELCVCTYTHRHALVSLHVSGMQLCASGYVYVIHTCVHADSCIVLVAPHPLDCLVPLSYSGYSDFRLPILPSDLTTGVRWEDHWVSSWDSAELGAAPHPDQLVPGA